MELFPQSQIPALDELPGQLAFFPESASQKESRSQPKKRTYPELSPLSSYHPKEYLYHAPPYSLQ